MVTVDPNQDFKSDFYGATPNTTKTFATQMSVSQDNSLLAYCVGKVVVVRKQANDLKDGIVVFIHHKCKTTAVDIAPNGVFGASADEEGNLKIWFLDDGSPKFSHQVLSTKVLGVHWNDKSDRLLVYGEAGKKAFARYVSWDSCNNMGEITGMSKNCISGDIKRSKPYFAVVASEDLSLRVYSGNNLLPKWNNKEHKSYISNAKFSPKGDRIAVVGLEKRITIYETETGTILLDIPKTQENQHKSSIIGCTWLNEEILITCSLDKTVKIWDLTNQKNRTLKVSEKDNQGDDSDQLHGLIIAKDYLIANSLDGTLNLWSLEKFKSSNSFEDFSEFPDRKIHGHQAHINIARYNKTQKKLYTADVNGKIVVWDQNKNTEQIKISNNSLVSMSFSEDDKYLHCLNVEGTITSYNTETKVIDCEMRIKEIGVGLSCISQTKLIVAFEKLLYVIEQGNTIKEKKLDFQASALDFNRLTKEIYLGDSQKGVIHVFNEGLDYIKEIQVHFYPISTIRVSNNGKLIASADTNKAIVLINSETKEVHSQSFCNHVSRVYGIGWSDDDTRLCSCGLDNSAISWDVTELKRIRTYAVVDIDMGVSCDFIGNNNQFAVVGNNCCPRIITI